MKQAVVINVSNEDVKILELKQVIPAGAIGERYVLPFDVAVKYKDKLHPVMIIDKDLEPTEGQKTKKKKKRRPAVKPLKGINISEKKCVAKQDIMKKQRSRYTYNKEG